MVPPKIVVFRSAAKREKFSGPNLRFEVLLTECEVSAILSALWEVLGRESGDAGTRTLKGVQFDLALYERLHRLMYGQKPDPVTFGAVLGRFGPGELRRAVEDACKRWGA